MNYKITIAYDGASFCGWQKQPNAVSIQQKLEETFSIFLGEKIRVTGSGRTDAGVHALGQTANFHTQHPLNMHRFMAASNGLLPKEIRVLSIEEVPDAFHARFSAKKKEYHYHIHLDDVILPFDREYKLHIRSAFNLPLFKEAAKLFVGTHDFTSFANVRGNGSKDENCVRTLDTLDIIEVEGGIKLVFSAPGFLYKMVRNITGTLIEVALGKLDPAKIEDIFNAKDRKASGRAAPPHGLFLVKVEY